MIITCWDCSDEHGRAKQFRYPCGDCAQQWIDTHRATGHNVEARPERTSDVYIFERL